MAIIYSYPHAIPNTGDALLGVRFKEDDSISTNTFYISDVAEIIRPYKVYSALLTQEGSSAPVATVLENTIGNIIWTRNATGTYDGTLTGAFPGNKTIILTSLSYKGNLGIVWTETQLSNFVRITTTDLTGVELDDVLVDASIEIRVYN